ncbi:MAG: hypothetical protein HOM14_00385 [Gammaproteobacteria bacterium]|jgi:predicted transcriptional regulator of viral defense system|nr:hypothetical protein [Gammaproteobacteria bacterium]MBT6549790.1 hypothetical protein [Gammaproteobacteria bacterium]MBT7208482.1 hypothetical protein [Gammaproteobacteria bacterium]
MPHSVKNKLSRQELFFEKVLASFSTRFASPTSDILSTRCISKLALLKQLLLIRDEIAFPGHKRISGKDILNLLERSKIIQPIITLDPVTNQKQENFYLLGLTSSENIVDPIELLQALEPKGVICYFTALEFYGLTTQIPSHHHIAKLVHTSLRGRKKNYKNTPPSKKNHVFNPLGKNKFTYEDIPYYLTNRDTNLILGIKERFLNERTKFRITSIEQTLLDTLHKPLSCGGSSVVFEAWENAIDKMQSNILLEYLQKINNNALSCRAGYMLQIMDYKINSDLSSFLSSVKNSVTRNNPELAIPLLPGLNYHQFNQEWFIRTP